MNDDLRTSDTAAPTTRGAPHVARASLAFHVALGCVLLPIVSLPFVVGAALWAWRGRAGAPLWAWRLAGLALVDLLVAGALVSLWLRPSPRLAPVAGPRPVIGVRIDDAPRGVAVEPVEGGPAALAGLRPGDLVLEVDGARVERVEDLQRAIGEGPLSTRRLRVERDGASFEVAVEPTRGAATGGLRAGRRGLFVPEHETSTCVEAALPRPAPATLALLALALALALALWRHERRVGATRDERQGGATRDDRRVGATRDERHGGATREERHGAPSGARFWLPFAGVFGAAWLVSMLARAGGCALVGGHAPGTFLLTLALQGLVLALGGAWLARRGQKVGPLLPPLGHTRTFAQSLLYALGWVPRAGVLALALHGLVEHVGLLSTSDVAGRAGTALDAFADTELGFAGGALLLLAGALLGPLAEELLFRGALLPHLARTLSPWRAITASGVLFGLLHVHHGPSIAGPLVMGVVLGWARARTGSLLVPFLLHASLNAASLTMVVLLR
ncbi:MAG: CPBP family intramembrane metalloprotease [Myxococcales bacterium]|nr:CPBP family intramembrane metalloprotease [Myxococcales bacterium]